MTSFSSPPGAYPDLQTRPNSSEPARNLGDGSGRRFRALKYDVCHTTIVIERISKDPTMKADVYSQHES